MKNYHRSGVMLLIIAGMCCGLPLVQSQPIDMQFSYLTDVDGLSQRTVRSILQDREGYMWFGTNDGLNRYDGYDITIYRHDPEDTTTISYNEISHIYEDSRGNLWIATPGAGLNRYDRDKDRFIRYDYEYLDQAHELWRTEQRVYTLTEGPDGALWIGTESGIAILNISDHTLNFLSSDPSRADGISHRSVTNMLTDHLGNVWVGTRNGLNLWAAEENRFEKFMHNGDDPHSISGNFIHTIYEDRSGTIWVGTQSGGLNRFDRDTGRFTSFQHDLANPYSISDNSAYTILEDSHGAFWIGTENEGLNLFDRETERFYHYKQSNNNPFSLNTNAIYDIYESNNQMLWLGTYNGGVNLTDRKDPAFEHYKHQPHRESSLSTHSVTTFLEDRNGHIWIGTDGGGVNLFNPGEKTFTRYRHEPGNENSLPGDVIFDLKEDRHGHIWIATYRNGLSRLDPDTQTFRHYRHDPANPNGLNHNDIFYIHFDVNDPDLLWIGTNGGGINLLDTRTDKFTHYSHNPDDPTTINQNDIRHIHHDKHGTLRIGNYDGYLVEFDQEIERFLTYNLTNRNFFTNVVQMIYEDSRDNLWLATWGGGLMRFDRETHNLTAFTERDGLPNNNLHAIQEDHHGYLWISTNNGLSRFQPDTGEFENYGTEDGLQSREFNPRAVLQDHNGFLYFGGVNGFNRFHPDSLMIERHQTPVLFSGFRLFNEPVGIDTEGSPLSRHISRTGHIELSHRQSVITFEYVTLNFDINKNDQYAYKLEGFDDSWNNVGNQRTATYTNLSPGEYRFRVRVADGSGEEQLGEKEASLTLIITPPFWRTYWFYGISSLFIIGLIGGGYQYRVYHISKRNRELEEEVAAQTRDLKKAMKELQSTRDQLMEKAHTAGMADMATNVLHDVGNILNSVNTSASRINDILNKSSIDGLKKANSLLRSKMDNIEEFILRDEKGKALLEYYLKLEEPVYKEQQELKKHNQRLSDKIALISEVVSAQQNYSSAIRLVERCSPIQIINDTLTLQKSGYDRHDITIKTDFKSVDDFEVEKSKLIHVLINLLKNAKDALKEKASGDRTITIRTWQDDTQIHISVADTGAGFDRNNRNKIFAHGFTTKKGGHGYGLHSCANYMKEMGGSIEADSDGTGQGAIFTIHLPRIPISQQEPVLKS